jgi:hypothetical protein
MFCIYMIILIMQNIIITHLLILRYPEEFYLLGQRVSSLFNPDDGGDTILQNIG